MNELITRLEASIKAGRAMHAYLFTGVDPDLTERAAKTAAALILYSGRDTERLKNDPDYMEFEGAVSVGDFRDRIRPEIYRETYGKNGRAVLLRSAHLLSEAVQNAMLKVLEEPPENTYFLLTGNEYGILPTIRSRCMILRCSAPDTSEIVPLLTERGASREEAYQYAVWGGCITARALRLYDDKEFRELRSSVISAFISSLSGAPDLKWSKVKRDKADLADANEMLLLASHDMLMILCGNEPEFCPDKAAELKKICSRFTIGEIGCIINRLTENAQRLATNSSGSAAFDRLFAELGALGIKKARQSGKKKELYR